MVLSTRKSGRNGFPRKDYENDVQRRPDLPPEYCTYRDEGCAHAEACLECPFPRCLYDTPRGSQRWVGRTRNGDMRRLVREGWKVRELAVLYGVSERTVQRALNAPLKKEKKHDAD